MGSNISPRQFCEYEDGSFVMGHTEDCYYKDGSVMGWTINGGKECRDVFNASGNVIGCEEINEDGFLILRDKLNRVVRLVAADAMGSGVRSDIALKETFDLMLQCGHLSEEALYLASSLNPVMFGHLIESDPNNSKCWGAAKTSIKFAYDDDDTSPVGIDFSGVGDCRAHLINIDDGSILHSTIPDNNGRVAFDMEPMELFRKIRDNFDSELVQKILNNGGYKRTMFQNVDLIIPTCLHNFSDLETLISHYRCNDLDKNVLQELIYHAFKVIEFLKTYIGVNLGCVDRELNCMPVLHHIDVKDLNPGRYVALGHSDGIRHSPYEIAKIFANTLPVDSEIGVFRQRCIDLCNSIRNRLCFSFHDMSVGKLSNGSIAKVQFERKQKIYDNCTFVAGYFEKK